MKKISAFLLVIGLLTLLLALPVSAAAEPAAASEAAEEAAVLAEEVTIEEEEVPLAGLPGVSRSDVARVMILAGVGMVVVAGSILLVGQRREHIRS